MKKSTKILTVPEEFNFNTNRRAYDRSLSKNERLYRDALLNSEKKFENFCPDNEGFLCRQITEEDY